MRKIYLKPEAGKVHVNLMGSVLENVEVNNGTVTGKYENAAEGKGINGDVIDDEDDTKEPLQTGWSMD